MVRSSGVFAVVSCVHLAACAATPAAPDGAVDVVTPDRDASSDVGVDTAPLADVVVADVVVADVVVADVASPDAGPVDPLVGVGRVERVRNVFMFTEGPQWRAREGDLLFSDIPANTIFRLGAGDAVSMFRSPSDNANGLAVDRDGRLYAAEHGTRRVSRTLADGARETLASHVTDGATRRRLNSPNDLVVRADGTVYFTDPPYGITAAQQELTYHGVYRITPAGALRVEWRGAMSSRPNGVVLSPDESTLYVADTASGDVLAWDVLPDGALTRERVLARTAGNPDGMAVDRAGNLYVSTRAGVQVLSASGRAWGVVAIPEQPANCAFGGADGRTLYVTARTGLYRVRVMSPGIY